VAGELVQTSVALASRELEVAQLQQALANRVWIEQAKGVLAALALDYVRVREAEARAQAAEQALQAAQADLAQRRATLGHAQVAAEERDRIADERDRVADERDRTAGHPD
jgi:HD superfamily phosphohydrolase YqeK